MLRLVPRDEYILPHTSTRTHAHAHAITFTPLLQATLCKCADVMKLIGVTQIEDFAGGSMRDIVLNVFADRPDICTSEVRCTIVAMPWHDACNDGLHLRCLDSAIAVRASRPPPPPLSFMVDDSVLSCVRIARRTKVDFCFL